MATTDDAIDISGDGGILKRVIVEAPEGAKGPPPKGYEVTAHYTVSSDLPPTPPRRPKSALTMLSTPHTGHIGGWNQV